MLVWPLCFLGGQTSDSEATDFFPSPIVIIIKGVSVGSGFWGESLRERPPFSARSGSSESPTCRSSAFAGPTGCRRAASPYLWHDRATDTGCADRSRCMQLIIKYRASGLGARNDPITCARIGIARAASRKCRAITIPYLLRDFTAKLENPARGRSYSLRTNRDRIPRIQKAVSYTHLTLPTTPYV